MPDLYYFNEPFSFVWDEDKNQINIKKHGISFEAAARVFFALSTLTPNTAKRKHVIARLDLSMTC